MLPIRRLRLELDRTLRSRAFFARAVGGRLSRAEYVELLGQLCWLIEGLTFGHALDLSLLGRADARDLDPAAPVPPPCPVVKLLPPRKGGVALSDALASDVCLAVLGTSWATDAAVALGHAFPRRSRLLDGLSLRSAASVERLAARLSAPGREAQPLYALAELARGSLLGLATYLDLTWPAPTTHHDLDRPENDDHARHLARA